MGQRAVGDGPRAVFAAMLASLTMSACATAPRSDSAALAKSGLETTGALAGDVNDLARRLERGNVQNAFSTTWQVCEDNPPLCRARTPAPVLTTARRELATTIAARARAVSALNGAYAALAAEAAYDAGTDASAAAANAFKTAQTYATLAGAGEIPALVSGVVSLGVGLLADRAQTRRLRADNLTLANAVSQLNGGLAKERESFDRIAQDVVEQEVAAQVSLVRSGLMSGAQALQPLTAPLGTVLVAEPDAVLAQSRSARAATEAVVRAAADGKVAALKARYAASLAALEELKRQHLAAAEDRPLDLSLLNQRLAELDGLLAQMTVH